jgi:hypothetical protein
MVHGVLLYAPRKKAAEGDFRNRYVEIVRIRLSMHSDDSGNDPMVLCPEHGSTDVNEPNSTD